MKRIICIMFLILSVVACGFEMTFNNDKKNKSINESENFEKYIGKTGTLVYIFKKDHNYYYDTLLNITIVEIKKCETFIYVNGKKIFIYYINIKFEDNKYHNDVIPLVTFFEYKEK